MSIFDSRSMPTEALFRYGVVSQVLALRAGGRRQSEAVRTVAARDHLDVSGNLRRLSRRSLYRWLAAFENGGVEALVAAPRKKRNEAGAVPGKLLDFMRAQKEKDPRASLPELIERARKQGVLAHGAPLDRVTLYRALKRRGVLLGRRKKSAARDMRRFAYPHRMQMVLCDGKHFRAGARRLRRVALFFLDDATRYGLHAVVGSSESAALFLRGLYKMLGRWGRMDILFLDHGPGFISGDTLDVVRRLGILLIHGSAAYPEGHGKIEKFNQLALARVIRNLDGRPEIDPHCGALTLRLQHFLRTGYNVRPHEALGKRSPYDRFHNDPRALRMAAGDEELRGHFVIHLHRRVSADHIVSVDSVAYEVPRGRSGEIVMLQRKLLDQTLWLLHQGRLIQLQPVDLAANAKSRRGRRRDDSAEPNPPLPPTAADMGFEQDLFPLVDPDGGFSQTPFDPEDP